MLGTKNQIRVILQGMDTQNPPASKLPSIRTYAKDLESKRKEKGQALPPEPVVEVVKVVEPPAPKESFLKKKKPVVISMPPIIVAEVPKPEKKPQAYPAVKKIDTSNVKTFNTSSTEFIVDNEDAAVATIITDTKKDRFKLFPALVTSIKGWFSDKKESYKQKKQPKYTVPETSSRKGVIQKATSQTGKVATADFSSIHERIKQREEEAEKEPSHLNWSAKTEPGFPLLAASKKAAVANVQFVSRKSYRTSPDVVVVKKEPIETPVVVTPPPVVAQVAEIVETPAPREPEVIVSEPETLIEETLPVVTEVVEQKPQVQKADPFTIGSVLHMDTNTLALGVSAAVLALAVFGTYAFITLSDEPELVTFTQNDITPLISSDLQEIEVTLITQSSLFEALVDVRSSLDETTQVVFTTTDGDSIPPNTLLPEIGFTIEPNFLKTISQVHFGYTSDRQPFVLLEVADLITAQGGLLQWEATMGTEINTFFGITGVDLQPTFIDGTLSGIDIRVLKTESGTERLLYGTVENMVIIATNSADFTELVNLRTK